MSQITYFDTVNSNEKQSSIGNSGIASYQKMVNALYFFEDFMELDRSKWKQEDAKKALADFDNVFFARHDFDFELLDKLVIEERLREKNRIAADLDKLNESYFLEGDSTEKPYSKEEIKSMLNTGSIRLSSKLKFGYNTKGFQSVYSFEEFNQDYKTFL